MRIAGLDEAGRGPVIGPLVIGCVVYTDETIHNLEEIGVDDSKSLTPRKREIMAKKIKETCDYYNIIILTPEKINELHYSNHLTLNQMEENFFAELLNSVDPSPEIVYLDACDIIEDRFGRTIQSMLQFRPKKMISKHKGDSIFKIVGAASILAKTIRDHEIERYKEEYGDIGSGYSSDPKTQKFLYRYYKKYQRFPPIVRTWWKTAENIKKRVMNEKMQKKITDFS
ncbi:MAG: ribonuclease HII [Candidatus Lokiarchaeota archaeon]|nr:ribonuclease HII [Candidatus Harpocratesius repetitus]